MPGIYPRLIEVRRLNTVAGVADGIGLLGYSGAEQSSSPTQGETVLFTGIPASIQKGPAGRKKDGALPTDSVFAPTWRIWIPLGSMAKGNIRDRDIIRDDELYRYEVSQAYWNILGYQLICIRLQA
jgi:hypothetical protein